MNSSSASLDLRLHRTLTGFLWAWLARGGREKCWPAPEPVKQGPRRFDITGKKPQLLMRDKAHIPNESILPKTLVKYMRAALIMGT